MKFKILKWKILILKIKIIGYLLDFIKPLLLKYDLRLFKAFYSLICNRLVKVYDEVVVYARQQ